MVPLDKLKTKIFTHLCKHSLSVYPFQNKIPPYESRITTAKLLIEATEYEVRLDMICDVCMCRCGWIFFSGV